MIGVDMVVISRIEKMLEKFGEKALRRFLSESEIKYVKKATTAYH